MWDWINDHKTELQALGPIATIVASAVAATVTTFFGLLQVSIAIRQKDIAASQRDIADRKFRYDLHTRRFEIYRGAIDLLAYVQTGDVSEQNKVISNIRLLQESRFFFPPEVVGLTEQLTKLALIKWSGRMDDIESDISQADGAVLARRLVDLLPPAFNKSMSFERVQSGLPAP